MSDEPGNPFDVPSEVAAARKTIIEAMERSAAVYGLNRSYGRLYGLLFFADEPVSLDDLADESGYAKSTVSTTMRKMQDLHMVYRRSVPGKGKRAYYEAERDFWTIVKAFLQGEVQREITLMTDALADAAATLEASGHGQARRDLARIQEMERMYERSQRIVDLLTGSSAERLADLLDRLKRQ